MMRSPRAMMDFQLRGRLPDMVTPSSPLITLLRSIPPAKRVRIRGIRLHPDLGYQCTMQFHNGEQLLNWLAPNDYLRPDSWPAESFRIKQFSRRLTVEDLKVRCADWPN
jgi:hypothetical protein